MKKIRLAAVAFVLLAASWLAFPALASQGSCIMPTSGTVSGLTLVNDINACNNSLISLWSGASAPAGPQAGQLWYNTNTNYIQQYDGSQWGNLWYVDSSNHLLTPSIGGGITTGSIAAAGTTNLGSIPQPYKAISGSGATITSFGSSAGIGTIHVLKFAGANAVTFNATSMLTPGGVSFNTAAGGIGIVLHLGSGNWQWLSYTPSRSPQFAAYAFSGNNSGASADPADVTIPGLTSKGSPVGADQFMIADSAASNAWKRVSLTSLLSLLGQQQPSLGGASALVITNNVTTPNTSIDVSADYVVMISAIPTPIFRAGVSFTINTTTTGCNALDIGTRSGNTWYNIWALDNGTTTCGVASLSATAPALPGGYTYAVRLGAMRTDVSGNFFRSIQRGNRSQYNGSTGPRQVSTSSAASATAQSLSNFVPPTATGARISLWAGSMLNNGSAIAIGSVTFASLNIAQNAYQANLGGGQVVQAVAQSVWADVIFDAAQEYYFQASGSVASIDHRCHGWTDKVNAN